MKYLLTFARHSGILIYRSLRFCRTEGRKDFELCGFFVATRNLLNAKKEVLEYE